MPGTLATAKAKLTSAKGDVVDAINDLNNVVNTSGSPGDVQTATDALAPANSANDDLQEALDELVRVP
jgi:hypothetical protein